MNNRWIVAVLCCVACLQARAQVCQTEGNIIRSVSVNANGEPVITWDAPADLPGNATGYIIYDYFGGTQCTNIIATVGLNVHSFPHSAAKPLTGRRAYSIAFDTGIGNKGNITQQHAFPWLAVVYDSCRYSLDLQWTAYEGWERVTYNVYGYERGTSPKLIASMIGGLQYTHANDIPDNVFYEVYVEAVNAADPAAKSASNRVEVFTKTLQRPAHLTIQHLRHADRAVQLQFAIDPATRLSTFHIMRSGHIGGAYAPVHTFSDKTLQTWTDNDVASVYYYRLAAENNCQLTAVQGNVLNNMELLITAKNGAWYLSWNKLFNGQSYSLARLEPSPQQLLLHAADTVYMDRIDVSAAALNYCYQIESVTDLDGKSMTVACADYEPEVLMPDAIDPKSTVQNPQTGRRRNQFGPVLFIAPSSYAYQLEIYDHNGGRIAFIEKNIADSPLEKSWTGINAYGDFVPENMYLYRLEVVFTNGKTVRKTGNVAVIY
jgi:hypothetical protein